MMPTFLEGEATKVVGGHLGFTLLLVLSRWVLAGSGRCHQWGHVGGERMVAEWGVVA